MTKREDGLNGPLILDDVIVGLDRNHREWSLTLKEGSVLGK
jgi:hypothetical protein